MKPKQENVTKKQKSVTNDVREFHPYGMFLPRDFSILILGTFPIGKFSNPNRRNEIIVGKDIDFSYGGSTNRFWRLIETCFSTELKTVPAIKRFLKENKIGMADTVYSCKRRNGSASDSALYEIEFNPKLQGVLLNPKLKAVICNSKQVEKWYRKMNLTTHAKIITLPSFSGQAALGKYQNADFVKWAKKHSSDKYFDFVLARYFEVFSKFFLLKKN